MQGFLWVFGGKVAPNIWQTLNNEFNWSPVCYISHKRDNIVTQNIDMTNM